MSFEITDLQPSATAQNLIGPVGARLADALLTLFGVGAARTAVVRGQWFRNGLEMLLIGALAAGFLTTVTAIRGLFGGPSAATTSWVSQHAVAMAVAWPVAITATSAILALARLRRLGR